MIDDKVVSIWVESERDLVISCVLLVIGYVYLNYLWNGNNNICCK